MDNDLINIFKQVSIGICSPEEAMEKFKHSTFELVGNFGRVDHDRTNRTGFPEVVLGIGKTPDQIGALMKALYQKQPIVIATRITTEVHQQLQSQLPGLNYYELAQIATLGTPQPRSGKVTILSAGTSDLPVAEEAAITVQCCGFGVERLWDVGVAGIHRLLHHQDLIRDAEVLIVVAGMDGALPSVVGGLANCPVIAVPTSVGYGASFQGLAALLTMLNSCAAGIGVVNIDNGFGAALLAAQILRLAYR